MMLGYLFRLLFACGLLILTNSQSLRMHRELEIFRECTVQVVTNQLENGEVYALEPLSFPVVQSNLQFTTFNDTQDEPSDEEAFGESYDHQSSSSQYPKRKETPAKFICHYTSYQLKPQHVSPRGTPPPRLGCAAMVFIDPPGCASWQMEPRGDYIFPESFLSLLYDPRIGRGGWDGPRDVVKGRQFFVHVRHGPDTLPSFDFGLLEMSQVIDEAIFSTHPGLKLVRKMNKLEFHLEQVSRYGEYSVRATMVVLPATNPVPTILFPKYSPLKISYNPSNFRSVDQLEQGFDKPGGHVWDYVDSDFFNSMIGGLGNSFGLKPKGSDYDHEYMLLNRKRSQMGRIYLAILSPNSTISFSSNPDLPRFYYVEAGEPRGLKWDADESKSLTFLTCGTLKGRYASRESPMSSWGLLVVAFDCMVWYSLLVTGLVSGILLQWSIMSLNRYNKRAGFYSCGQVFGALTFVYSIMLMQRTNVIKRFKVLCGLWALVGIVMSYAYRGDNIREFNMPVETKREWLGFYDLLVNNVTLYTPMVVPRVTPLGSTPKTKNPLEQVRSSIERQQYYLPRWVNQLLYKPRDMDDAKRLGGMWYIMNILARGNNTAYIDTRNSVLAMFFRLSSWGLRCNLGVESMGQRYNIWGFENVPWSASTFQRRLRALDESGIELAWKGWWAREDSQRNEAGNYNWVKAISMGDKIVVVFYLLGIGCGVTAGIFLFELVARAIMGPTKVPKRKRKEGVGSNNVVSQLENPKVLSPDPIEPAMENNSESEGQNEMESIK